MKMRIALSCASMLVLACNQQQEISESQDELGGGGYYQFDSVIDLASGENVRQAYSVIARRPDDNRLKFKVTTRATPGAAYTLWLCGFDEPSQCAAPPCTLEELVGGVGESYCQWGAGAIADPDTGRLVLSGISDFTTEVILGDGIDNISGGEIHLVVRTHDSMSAADLGAQLTSFNGGCPPGNCVDEQVAIHLAP